MHALKEASAAIEAVSCAIRSAARAQVEAPADAAATVLPHEDQLLAHAASLLDAVPHKAMLLSAPAAPLAAAALDDVAARLSSELRVCFPPLIVFFATAPAFGNHTGCLQPRTRSVPARVAAGHRNGQACVVSKI